MMKLKQIIYIPLLNISLEGITDLWHVFSFLNLNLPILEESFLQDPNILISNQIHQIYKQEFIQHHFYIKNLLNM